MSSLIRRAAGLLCSLVVGLALVSLLSASPQTGRDGGTKPAGRFDEAAACMGCHTFPTQNDIDQGALDFVLLTEYATWKTQDKHAQAYAVLTGPRGRAIGQALGMDVTREPAGCLGCHAMSYLGKHEGQTFDPEEGVSCAGCHGPPEKWLQPHRDPKWRTKSAAQKEELGMWDVRSPLRRAELCASCHVGRASEGKVLTHAMYAAGHPILPPLEIVTFAENLPQHWRGPHATPYLRNASEEVKALYPAARTRFPRTQMALAGGVIVLRESLRLVSERAGGSRAIVPERLWPELSSEERANAGDHWGEVAMAQADCAACHHDLAAPSWRQARGYGYPLPDGRRIDMVPGRPTLPLWPFAIAQVAARQGQGRGALAGRNEPLTRNLELLARTGNEVPFGRPAEVAEAARLLVRDCDALVAEVMKRPLDEVTVRQMIQDVCTSPQVASADADTARQLASFVRVAVEELSPTGPEAVAVRKLLTEMEGPLNLRPYASREARQEQLGRLIGELAGVRNLEGMKTFSAALRQLDNLDLQKGLRANPFLRALRDDVGNKKLTKLLQREDVVGRLQELSDEELRTSLRRASDYSPQRFREQMSQLGRHFGR